jgi:MFS family permease
MLLSYIGSADVSKGYTKLKLSEVVSVSKIVQQKINTFLYSGQRVKDFTGFKTFTNPVVYSNLSVLKIEFVNNKKEILFYNQNNMLTLIKENFSLITDKGIMPTTSSENKITFKESSSYYKIELPLYSKFESVGYMSVLFSKTAITKTLDNEFSRIYYSIPIVSLLYLFFLIITNSIWGHRWKIFITSSYSIAYITLASFMIYTLIVLYTDGIEGKSKALIQTLTDRISLASELKVPIESFSKLDTLLDSYIGKDSDVALIELRKDNEIIVSSSNKFNDSSLVIKINMNGNYERYSLSAYIPKTIIYEKLWRNTKNFLILFLASTIVAFMFLDIAVIFRRKSEVKINNIHTEEDKDKEEILKLEIIKPVFFLTIFAEGLMLSFLPQYLGQSALESNFGSSASSLLFTLYFLIYALVLIPSNKYIERYGIKLFLLIGVSLYTIGAILLIFTNSFYILVLSRIIAGMGQGMVFAGVQSYIIEVASEKRRVQATSIIVYGYNAGILSGTAIGALLVKFLGESGIFMIYCSIGIFLFIQIAVLFKTNKIKAPMRSKRNDILEFAQNIKILLSSKCTSKGTLLIGIPTKIILGGGIIFSIPLLLTSEGYLPEDIGQIVIFYSIGVLLCMPLGAYISSRFSNKIAIVLGSFIGIIALIFISKYSFSESLALNTAFLLFSMLFLGIGHSFIHAPIISYITSCDLSANLTKTKITSVYRFIERAGHASGPLIASQIIIFTSQGMSTFFILAMFSLVVTILFIIIPSRKSNKLMAPKMSNTR